MPAPGTPTVFLGFQGEDPSAELLAACRRVHPFVKPESQSGRPSGDEVYDEERGERGVVIHIGVEFVRDWYVRASYYLYHSPEAGRSYGFSMTPSRRGWVVVKYDKTLTIW